MILAFSGASFSGKTTFIENIKKYFGNSVVTFDEIIRSSSTLSIDELRKNTSEYLKTQLKIINEKILQEKYKTNIKNKIFIFDRSLVDSYFYYLFYVDKAQLTDSEEKIYYDFLLNLQKEVEISINERYDKVFLFKPLNCIENNDKMRPRNLFGKQEQEYNLIRTLTHGISTKKNVIDFDVMKHEFSTFINECFDKIPNSYSEYRQYSEEEIYEPLNIFTNSYGSIEALNSKINDFLWKPVLYTTDKKNCDSILESIKNISLDLELMNSRCYPTGFWEKNNLMIVGEAPGMKGRGINEYFLKPTFIFTRNSYLLRNSLRNLEKMPYITNLCKFAQQNNKISHENFNKCFDIFQTECSLMKPAKIIALGNNVYEYLIKKKLNIPLVKCLHPYGSTYKGLSEIEYSNVVKECL